MQDQPFTRLQLRDCARRELAMRRRVYPGLVAKGRMTQAEADAEIAMMAQIETEFEPSPAPDLFAGEY